MGKNDNWRFVAFKRDGTVLDLSDDMAVVPEFMDMKNVETDEVMILKNIFAMVRSNSDNVGE